MWKNAFKKIPGPFLEAEKIAFLMTFTSDVVPRWKIASFGVPLHRTLSNHNQSS